MPFIPVPLAAQLNVRATINGIPVENVLGFERVSAAPWDAASLQLACETAQAAWSANMLSVFASGYTATSVYGRVLDNASAPIYEEPFPAASIGTASGETLPGSVALVITHRTGFAGRSFRGRTYIGGLSELSVSGNNAVSGYVATLANQWDFFIGDMLLGGFVLSVISRYAAGVPRTTGVSTPVIVSVIRDAKVDTQRRRLS